MASSTTQKSPTASQAPAPAATPLPAQSDSGSKGRMLIYILGIIVVIGVIAVIFLLASNLGGAPATTTVPGSSTPAIYLGSSGMQSILASPIANYSTTSIYDMASPDNITFLEYFAPALANNVTNGWVTAAEGSSLNNATLQYFVLQTSNASNMSAILAQSFAETFPSLPTVANGNEAGMNYTYETYQNSTTSFQIFSGWRSGYVALALIIANNYTANQTQIAQVISGNLP